MSGTRQPWRRVRGAFPLAATAVAAALAVGLIPPATAQTPSPDPAVRGVVDGDGTEISAATRPLAPGAELTGAQRLESDKWLDVQTLTVDLAADLSVDYLATEDVADAATIGDLAAAHDPGAGRTTVAAINADFFDINATNAPLAPGIRDGELVQSGSLNRTSVVGIDSDGSGRVLDVLFGGKVAGPDGEAALTSYNAASLPADGIGVYTTDWGEADRLLPVLGAQQVTEVVVEEGRVTSVSEKPGRERVPAEATVLLGRDAGAAALAALEAGDAVEMEYAARTADGSALPRTAVGGNGLLVVDGEAQDWEGRPNNATAPRTAVGFSEDGSDMYVVVIDGRQAHSGGVTLTELAVMMQRMGAHSALNLDGGGSTTLLAREVGTPGLELVNKPSDGAQRVVPNGLALTAPAGGGEATGFRVATRARPALAPNGETMGDARPDRVLAGLTRQLDAHAHDATLGPAAPTRADWSVAPATAGTVDAAGVFTGAEPGRALVSANAGRATGALELTVLGGLERLEPTRRRLALSGAGDTTRFGLLGHDASGYSAPVEPRDVTLEYDTALIEVEPEPSTGGWTVRALTDAYTASTITARVGDVTTVLSAGVGLRATGVADFENAADWRFSHSRAAGELFAEPEGHEGAALGVRYEFDRSTGTRAAYATPAGGDIGVAGQPRSFTLRVRGDGNGAWPALHLKDATGTSRVLRGEHLEFIGWRQITFDVPDGFAYPAAVHRLYIAETRPDAAYRGEIAVDTLVAETPPDADLPDSGPVTDPLITTAAATDARDWRFALVSDAQFVARDPDSDVVAAARRTLREARSSEPEFVVINGDWVDEGSPADLEFARTMIEEELGDLPWYYVPGNHEVMGGSIGQWEEVFGARQQSFDHRGTRFVTLDTSSLSISGGGYAQWRELRERLDAAAADDAVGSVVVISHVPPQDPGPQPASRLTDRMDAWLLERWLTEFREETGKGAAHLGSHVGLFDAHRHNGVPYLINGNAGKGPSAPPDRGGFTGWSTVGVDELPPAARAEALADGRPAGPDWLSVRTRPHTDGLTLTAPASVAVGKSAPVTATVAQALGGDAVREVPAAWPVSTDWSGSATLHVGDPADATRRHAAVLDPEAGTLTALRPGRVTVTVSVNGETAEAVVALAR
ncbi:phosphodiester glycosidase family protein [Streptomyces lonarensis]|uniref:Multidrug transporter n=1 Tax=Streptomyces lonarensis TaxID=700599 RepID=A0A7X6I0F9_9ACTN|nr:phosphodiester glycosidase family protein [Streptomyces lonarensis]NJQ07244.1 multidrug transporter [Streptomyces lonarensis]